MKKHQMGLLLPSPGMLLILVLPMLVLSWLSEAQSIGSNLALDALLQDYAFRAFVRPKTGVVYDGVVPSNLTGIKIAAVRLRSGSLRKKGVKMFKEFHLPIGVVEEPYVERLVLVYHNLGNWSVAYYPLPGYSYLAPVLGLLAYSASNLSATGLPELDISAPVDDPITINFTDVRPPLNGLVAKCVWFDLNGVPSFSNVTSNSICSTYQEGHFSIVVESVAPSPAPPSIPPAGGPPSTSPGQKPLGKKTNSRKVWIVVGSVIPGLLGLFLLSFLIFWLCKLTESNKMQQMEKAAEVGEPLSITSVGELRVPAATVTRTRPALENEYVL